MKCKFCKVVEGEGIDFYLCEECESIMCFNCMYTSIRSGADYCFYCKRNIELVGKKL